MCATSLGLHAYYTRPSTGICFFASFLKLAQAIALSLPKFLFLMATHFAGSCTAMFVPWAQEQTEPWWQSPWKNAQNYFTQKQRFLLDSFINVTQTPFWNKQIYPPFKADNSNNSFCTLVSNSKLYAVASMSTVVGYFSNSSICYGNCYFLFKSKAQSPLPPGLKVHRVAEECRETLCTVVLALRWYQHPREIISQIPPRCTALKWSNFALEWLYLNRQ